MSFIDAVNFTNSFLSISMHRKNAKLQACLVEVGLSVLLVAILVR